MVRSSAPVYVLSTDHLGIIFIASNKKKAFEYLDQHPKFKPDGIKDYWTFSQTARYNEIMKINTKTAVVTMQKFRINMTPDLGDSLFS